MAKKKTPASRAEQKAATQARRTARQEKAARAAEAQKAQAQARKRKERMIVIGVVLAVALIVGLVAWALARNDAKDATPPANVTDTYAIAVGEADAEHTVVIYEDFLCPACGDLESLVAEPLDQAVEDGRARVEYRPVAILGRAGDYSLRSANAVAVVLDTAGVEAAKELHDTLYEEQPSEGGDHPDDDWLVEQAVAAGADEDAVRPGIEDRQFEGWVEAATDDFSQEGHTGTPTVLLDGEVVDGSTTQEVAASLMAGLQ